MKSDCPDFWLVVNVCDSEFIFSCMYHVLYVLVIYWLLITLITSIFSHTPPVQEVCKFGEWYKILWKGQIKGLQMHMYSHPHFMTVDSTLLTVGGSKSQ